MIDLLNLQWPIAGLVDEDLVPIEVPSIEDLPF